MDEKREYVNPYEDYSPIKASKIIDEDQENKIDSRFQNKLQSGVEHLLESLDVNLRRAAEKDRDYSIYTGTTGIALLYFHIATLQNKKTFLKLSAELIEVSLPRLRGRRLSLLTGDAGPLAVGAAVQNQLGNRNNALALAHRLKGLVPQALDVRDTELPDELLYGRAGLVMALLFVRHHLGEEAIEQRAVQQVVSAMIASGKLLSQQQHSDGTEGGPPLMYEWHGKKYLGAAHGLCGILHTLILARSCLPGDRQSELDSLVCQTLDWLLASLLPSGNLPSSLGNGTDRLVHWCHGAPGLAPLLCLAYKEFGEKRYLEAARGCGEVVWKRGLLKKGCGICHGSAGNAYTFLYLYQVTKDIGDLYRALKFAEWCTEPSKHQIRSADRPLSLFEGLAGTIYFLADVQRPLQAKFPTFSV